MKVFNVIHVIDAERVYLVAYQLKNVSRIWFNQWMKGPAPSSASAPAPRSKGEHQSMNL